MVGYRFLFTQLVRRELRQKYKGSALGLLWYVVNPLVLMGAYTLMFGVVLHVARVPDYPLFLMIGLVVWTFFQQSLMAAADSLIVQGALIRKARFPREAIPAATVTVQLITLLAVLVLVSCVAVPILGSVSLWLLLVPLLLLLLAGFVLGCALMVAVLHAYYRDVSPVLAAVLLPWFFITPIFFRASALPVVGRHPILAVVLNWVNPMAPFMEAIRTIIYAGSGPGWGRILYMICAAAVSLALGGALFRRLDGELAVVV
jgi:lipopolysaccharide transport system permease protein